MHNIDISLIYRGNESDVGRIDLYDIGRALVGFQRSMALTIHAVINDEVITQATSLRGAALRDVRLLGILLLLHMIMM